jgi:hypothetical protein
MPGSQVTETTGHAATSANLGFEAQLWQTANALRGSMDAAEYKHVVLGLIFLKYISDAFEQQPRTARSSRKLLPFAARKICARWTRRFSVTEVASLRLQGAPEASKARVSKETRLAAGYRRLTTAHTLSLLHKQD